MCVAQCDSNLCLCVCGTTGSFVNITDGCEQCPPNTYYTGEAVANPCEPCPFCGFCQGGNLPALPEDGCTWVTEAPPTFEECTPKRICLRGGLCIEVCRRSRRVAGLHSLQYFFPRGMKRLRVALTASLASTR